MPGFPSAPEWWGTSTCTASHPKPGWCSAALHSREPCANLTPWQHKTFSLTAPILIIWHSLWIFTSPWVRYCLGCSNYPQWLLTKQYQGILCHLFSCLLMGTGLWVGELRVSLTFQGTGDDADSTHCPLPLEGLLWVVHWGPVGH